MECFLYITDTVIECLDPKNELTSSPDAGIIIQINLLSKNKLIICAFVYLRIIIIIPGACRNVLSGLGLH